MLQLAERSGPTVPLEQVKVRFVLGASSLTLLKLSQHEQRHEILAYVKKSNLAEEETSS